MTRLGEDRLELGGASLEHGQVGLFVLRLRQDLFIALRATATRRAALSALVIRGVFSGVVAVATGEVDPVAARAVVFREANQALVAAGFEEAREAGVAVLGLVEGGLFPQHRLLHQAREHLARVFAQDALDGLAEQLEGLVAGEGAGLGRLYVLDGLAVVVAIVAIVAVVIAPVVAAAAATAHGGLLEALVEDELVAALDQEAAGRATGAHADHAAVELFEALHGGREVAVARQQHEGVDVGAGERQLHGIDHQGDVGAVLVLPAVAGHLDHGDALLEELLLELREAPPVAVGAGHQDAALVLEASHDGADVELAQAFFLAAGGHVLEVNQYTKLVFQGSHSRLGCWGSGLRAPACSGRRGLLSRAP